MTISPNLSHPMSSMEERDPEIVWRHPLIAVALLLLCLATVAGNCLVVLAVCTKKYLQTPTGFLIVSLAAADLLVGTVVMPINSIYEMTSNYWIFRSLAFCDLWHSIDILASTASIWNLCVISLDRFIANRDPIGYRDKVTGTRILWAIALVWSLSALLSFPAIAWWRTFSPHLYEDNSKCEFTDNVYYVSFSSLVSFFIPLCIILFAYGRVFLIATRHSRALKRGHRPLNGSDANGAQLRVHYGRAQKNNQIETVTSGEAKKKRAVIVVTPIEKQNSTAIESVALNGEHSQLIPGSNESGSKNVKLRISSGSGQQSPSTETAGVHDLKKLRSSPNPPIEQRAKSHDNCGSNQNISHLQKQASLPSVVITQMCSDMEITSSPNQKSDALLRSKSVRVRTVKQRSKHLAKYLKEQRAARTLGMVVGLFILCWLPFFVVNVLIVVCADCITEPKIIFLVLTWLGHLNSALNPLIYSRFSREFRRAFTEILTCSHRRNRGLANAMQGTLGFAMGQIVAMYGYRGPMPQLKTANTISEHEEDEDLSFHDTH